jgi:tripartite-type tricarboxylate transporter receptor subunit TctC
VVDRLARDLKASFPGTTGFSAASLWRMRQFHETYTEPEFLAQLVRERGREAKGPQASKALPGGHPKCPTYGHPNCSTLAYDPAKDLLPVVLTSSQPNMLAVAASHPAKSLPEFVSWAKKQDNKINYASVGAGSSSHLTMELFKSTAAFDPTHVPFAGSPPAGISVASEETQALFTVAPALLPLIQGGRIRLLAKTSLKRTETMKDLPTVAESGYPEFEAIAWNGIFTPAGTPSDVVRRISADVNEVMKDKEVRQAFAKQGLVIGGGSPDEFKTFIAEETIKWGAIIKKVGIGIDWNQKKASCKHLESSPGRVCSRPQQDTQLSVERLSSRACRRQEIRGS